MNKVELWQFLSSDVWTIEASAQAAEADGWSGLVLTDSQNLSPDPYISLALAAKCTKTLGLGTGVTNPVTRHAAVTANLVTTLQEVSAGRMTLGIGRGDSALFNIGRKPAPLNEFENYLALVKSYLRGETTKLNDYPSQLRWLEKTQSPRVPLDVAGTGPKVLALAAQYGDRVSFAMGVDTTRLRWGIQQVRNALPADKPPPSLGAYINVCVTENLAQGVEMIRSGVSTFAHFSGMPGASKTTAASDQAVFQAIDKNYDRANHGRSQSRHAQALPDEFIQRFAIVGDAGYVSERLLEIGELGIQRLFIIGPNLAEFPDQASQARRAFVEQVLPNVQT